jgi:hypothetical protein
MGHGVVLCPLGYAYSRLITTVLVNGKQYKVSRNVSVFVLKFGGGRLLLCWVTQSLGPTGLLGLPFSPLDDGIGPGFWSTAFLTIPNGGQSPRKQCSRVLQV